MISSYHLSFLSSLFTSVSNERAILPKKKSICTRDAFIVLFLICMTCVNGTSIFECSVCLEYSSHRSKLNTFRNCVWYNGDQKYVLPCGHSFHLDCIALWIQKLHQLQEGLAEEERKEITCPNCRYNIPNTDAINTELKQLQQKPRLQKFAEKVKLGVKKYIFPTIMNIVKCLFWFVWYILESVGKMKSLILIFAFLQVQLLFKTLLYKVGQTRLWKWTSKKSSNTKRKISNLLENFYMKITGFPDLMWDIYILGPINSVQQYLLTDKADKTMNVYAYKITVPTLKAYKHETILNEVEETKDLVHTLNNKDLLYSCINFSKYKEKQPKLMKIFTEKAGIREPNFFYIHSRHSIDLKKVESLQKNMIVTCDIEGNISNQIYIAAWRPFGIYDDKIHSFLILFGIFFVFPMPVEVFTKILLYYMILVPYLPIGPAFFIIIFWVHLDRYIRLVSPNTFNTYYNQEDVTTIKDKKNILELLEQ